MPTVIVAPISPVGAAILVARLGRDVNALTLWTDPTGRDGSGIVDVVTSDFGSDYVRVDAAAVTYLTLQPQVTLCEAIVTAHGFAMHPACGRDAEFGCYFGDDCADAVEAVVL